MVIGRVLGRRPTIKALQDCLKLHLPTSYTSVTLLTRGFFEMFFMNEKGVKFGRKITAVEWSSLNLSFSRYIPNFDANVQGGWNLTLTHNKSPIPGSSQAIQKHKSSHYHGEQNWRSSRNKTRRFIHKKIHRPHDHGGNQWHQQVRQIHSYPLHGERGNREGYYTTRNPILGLPKSMPEMSPIWAFRPNLHSDQNPNLERKKFIFMERLFIIDFTSTMFKNELSHL